MQRQIRILGTGKYLPGRIVISRALDVQLGLPAGAIERKTNVVRRHFVTDETAAQMAAAAARAAVAAAGLRLADLDCLVAANATMDQGMPYNAALVHAELGLNAQQTPAFDIGTSCLSFLSAFDLMAAMIAAGRYRRVMIVSSDIASYGLNWNVLESSAIFGDGAAAAVIAPAEAGESGKILAANFITLSAGQTFCEIKGGGTRYFPTNIQGELLPHFQFKMDGKAVFRLVFEHMPRFVATLLDEAGVRMSDLALVIPHQASDHGLKHVGRLLKIPPKRLLNIFATHGNQVAASLPTALHEAIAQERIQRGDRVLLLGTSAGVTLGGMVIEY
jgi:3-oxoacyl-[acyl-carrier-protein] synthase-3